MINRILVVIALFSATDAFARGGSEGTGGGVLCDMMVQVKLTELKNASSEFQSLKTHGVSLETLKRVIQENTFSSAPNLHLDGKKVDAINNRIQKSVVFDQDKCTSLVGADLGFAAFVIHEILGILNIPDPDYIVSKTVFVEMRGRIPVMGAYQEPWFLHNYNNGDFSGSGVKFTVERFAIMVRGRTGAEFAQDVIQANGPRGIEITLRDGKMLYKDDYYYITYDDANEVVSVFIEGEENGKMPSYSTGRPSDDWLCFFKGLRAGTCTLADDT